VVNGIKMKLQSTIDEVQYDNLIVQKVLEGGGGDNDYLVRHIFAFTQRQSAECWQIIS
jgi:hypothetical protein